MSQAHTVLGAFNVSKAFFDLQGISATYQARMKAVNSKPVVMHGGVAEQLAHTLDIVLSSDRALHISTQLGA
ncbi:hypothetical protein PRUB_a0665 [Pseudoalteromonas rubra]|uniref:Uncharacterized protein n=1 Tax=Pseudoalteromonas rubra TaxID=43658 RepID=A0A8T0C626_9GAMM|nr:hypothetical protein PRUB_a0665 [Pseudoalteromonas rubra]